MKTVILIGDSVRLGYEGKVRELLGENVRVLSPSENCRFTKYTLWGMFSWMVSWGNPKVDVIHWNTGAWDLHRCTADGKIFTPLASYIEDCDRLVTQMESYTKNLIWATITPGGRQLNEHKPVNSLINSDSTAPAVYLTDYEDRWNSDVDRYNRAATALMKRRGVRVNDLNSVIAADPERLLSEDGIHPSDEGYSALAQKVVSEIKAFL